jgi:hypothetical protein
VHVKYKWTWGRQSILETWNVLWILLARKPHEQSQKAQRNLCENKNPENLVRLYNLVQVIDQLWTSINFFSFSDDLRFSFLWKCCTNSNKIEHFLTEMKRIHEISWKFRNEAQKSTLDQSKVRIQNFFWRTGPAACSRSNILNNFYCQAFRWISFFQISANLFWSSDFWRNTSRHWKKIVREFDHFRNWENFKKNSVLAHKSKFDAAREIWNPKEHKVLKEKLSSNLNEIYRNFEMIARKIDCNGWNLNGNLKNQKWAWINLKWTWRNEMRKIKSDCKELEAEKMQLARRLIK